jgi:hypothetical protein
MEIKRISNAPISKELKEKLDRQEKNKEEASKLFGDYLISITNLCFDKCMNTNEIYFSKLEDKCVENCFFKFSESHLYAYKKFLNINMFTEIENASSNVYFERANDYGDYYGLLEYMNTLNRNIDKVNAESNKNLNIL